MKPIVYESLGSAVYGYRHLIARLHRKGLLAPGFKPKEEGKSWEEYKPKEKR